MHVHTSVVVLLATPGGLGGYMLCKEHGRREVGFLTPFTLRLIALGLCSELSVADKKYVWTHGCVRKERHMNTLCMCTHKKCGIGHLSMWLCVFARLRVRLSLNQLWSLRFFSRFYDLFLELNSALYFLGGFKRIFFFLWIDMTKLQTVIIVAPCSSSEEKLFHFLSWCSVELSKLD